MRGNRLLSARIAYNAGNRLERNLTNLPLLTTYRPNFCAECGEKIVRLRWRMWTSRRFCGSCAPKFARTHALRRTLTAIVLLFAGMLIGRGTRQQPRPLVIERPPATQNSPTAPAPVAIDDVYICGARTKKGTPCSRRVHGPVRCWQHKGVPAMLPVEKLRVSD